jgi:DNA-binding Lrp family transcriptional regulator
MHIMDTFLCCLPHKISIIFGKLKNRQQRLTNSKILVNNCRTSYRNIGHTLNISTNTAKKRVNNLVSSKVIEQFTTVVNFSFLGYDKVLTVVLGHDDNNDNNDDIDEKIANYLRKWGNV